MMLKLVQCQANFIKEREMHQDIGHTSEYVDVLRKEY
jgi:hypothetical protein